MKTFNMPIAILLAVFAGFALDAGSVSFADDTPQHDQANVLLSSEIKIKEYTAEVACGSPIDIALELGNCGSARWRAERFFLKIPRVVLVNHEGEILVVENLDCQGYELPRDLFPGDGVMMKLRIETGEDRIINGDCDYAIISAQMLKGANEAWFGQEAKVKVNLIAAQEVAY